MACVLPPELEDRVLLAYIDGEADHHVAAHLKRCSYCREKTQRLARLQGQLTARLYRLMCPSTITLGEYHLGILPRDQAQAVAQHMAQCPHCTRETAQLQNYLDELASDLAFNPWKQKVKVLIAQLVPGKRENRRLEQLVFTPTLSVRGEEQGLYLYQANGIQVFVEVQDDAEQRGHKVVLGVVTGMDDRELMARLSQAERRVATAPVDDLGNFTISNLAPGSYALILASPEVEVHIQDLEI